MFHNRRSHSRANSRTKGSADASAHINSVAARQRFQHVSKRGVGNNPTLPP